jgi:hypothetical protein
MFLKQTKLITFMPYPGHVVTWHDSQTKHVTAQLVLPSGCGPDDIHTSVVDGGMAVEIIYIWPDIVLDAMGVYNMCTNFDGYELYPNNRDIRNRRSIEFRINENVKLTRQELLWTKCRYESRAPSQGWLAPYVAWRPSEHVLLHVLAVAKYLLMVQQLQKFC